MFIYGFPAAYKFILHSVYVIWQHHDGLSRMSVWQWFPSWTWLRVLKLSKKKCKNLSDNDCIALDICMYLSLSLFWVIYIL